MPNIFHDLNNRRAAGTSTQKDGWCMLSTSALRAHSLCYYNVTPSGFTRRSSFSFSATKRSPLRGFGTPE